MICVQFVRELLAILIGGLAFALFVDLRGWNLLIAFFARSIAWSAVQPGYLQICLDLVSNKQPKWSALFSHLAAAGQMFLATSLFIFAVIFGLVFFILPGLFLAVALSLYGFLIVDKKAAALNSLEFSYQQVKRHFWYTASFIFSCLAAGYVFPFAIEPLLPVLLASLYVASKGSEE